MRPATLARSVGTTLDVPPDHDDPGGAAAQVAPLRVPARGESMGSLLLDRGGPGGTGMNFAAGLARGLVPERFDLIGFHLRGLGATTPAIDCSTHAELRAGTAPLLISAGTQIPPADARCALVAALPPNALPEPWSHR